MNYKKLIYKNELGKSVIISRDSSLILTNIIGLDSPELSIETVSSPFQDGETIQHEKLEPREVVIQGFINADWQSREAIKSDLKRVFNPKLSGELTFEYLGKTYLLQNCRAISGMQFAKIDLYTLPQPFEITLYAEDPYWLDGEAVNFELNQVDPLFEFDLELTEDGIEMGSMNNSGVAYYNDGDAPTPVVIEIFGPVQTPKVVNLETGEFIAVKQPLLGNEKMIINTEFGNKSVVIVNDRGEERNAFNYIDLNSTFFELQPGDNWIKFEAEVGADTATINIKFRKLYTGV